MHLFPVDVPAVKVMVSVSWERHTELPPALSLSLPPVTSGLAALRIVCFGVSF